MTKKERVLAAIRHQPTDRIPKGDLLIENGLLKKLLPEEQYGHLSPMAQQIAVRELLNCDIMVVHEYPAELVGYADDGFPILQTILGDLYKDTGRSTHLIKPGLADIEEVDSYPVPDVKRAPTRQLDYFHKNSDLFLLGQINGPVGSAYWMLGMEDYMCYCMTNLDEVEELTRKIMEFEVERAKLLIRHGADGILLADDIGFNSGTMLPPNVMDRVAYPYFRQFIQEVKKYRNVPIFLHSDGNISSEIPKIIEAGFDGLQSLQPSAGMDIVKIKQEYGDKLCLMGNLDLDYLMPFGTPEDVEREVRRLIKHVALGGGFILSTCNILTDAVKPENAIAMYRAAEAPFDGREEDEPS